MTMIVVKMSVIFLSSKLLVMVILIIFIIIKTIGDHGRHFITDSACNALYVFPDKTLRAQSENQSPRWCYQTEKEKRDFFEAESFRFFFGKKYTWLIHSRFYPVILSVRSLYCDINPDTTGSTQSPPVQAEWCIWEHKNCIRPTPLYLQTFHTVVTPMS